MQLLGLGILVSALFLALPAAAQDNPSAPAGESAEITKSAAVPRAQPQAADQKDASAPADKPAEDAKPEPPKPPVITLHIDVNLATQRMTVKGPGINYAWPVSSGVQTYPTPRGTFRPQWLARMWYSRQYDLAPMPYSIFFKEGSAIHGSASTGSLGRPASHGCVRLATGNAKTLYGLVTRHGLASTRIVVHGNPNYGSQVAERRGPGSGRTYMDRPAYYYAYDGGYNRYGYAPTPYPSWYGRPYRNDRSARYYYPPRW